MRRLRLHPRQRILEQFADVERGGPLPPRAAGRLAAHLASCQDCRTTIAFLRDLRAASISLPFADAPPRVLARVIAARAQGQRMILPTVDAAPRRTLGASRWMAAAAAVVLAAVTAAVAHRLPTERGSPMTAARRERQSVSPVGATAAADTTSSAVAELFVSAGFLPRIASAQEVPSAMQPSIPPVTGVDGSRLRPMQLAFARRWTDSAGHVAEDALGTIDVAADAVDGRPAWRVVHVWTAEHGGAGEHGERVEAETLWVARDDLRPMARAVHVAPYSRYRRINITQRFAGDSVLGRMTTDGGDSRGVGRPIAQRLPPAFGPFVTDALAPLLLSTVSITPGWRGSVSMLGWAVRPRDVFTPFELRVVGEERVTVPAGTFDCWKLTVAAGSRSYGYWVRKSDGIGVLSRDEAERARRGVREIVLLRE